MPHFKNRFETPLQELIETAGRLDADEQLDLMKPQECIALLEPEAIQALGTLALRRAQEWLQTAYLCRDELVEEGFIEKSRKRAIDLAQAVPELRVGDA